MADPEDNDDNAEELEELQQQAEEALEKAELLENKLAEATGAGAPDAPSASGVKHRKRPPVRKPSRGDPDYVAPGVSSSLRERIENGEVTYDGQREIRAGARRMGDVHNADQYTRGILAMGMLHLVGFVVYVVLWFITFLYLETLTLISLCDVGTVVGAVLEGLVIPLLYSQSWRGNQANRSGRGVLIFAGGWSIASFAGSVAGVVVRTLRLQDCVVGSTCLTDMNLHIEWVYLGIPVYMAVVTVVATVLIWLLFVNLGYPLVEARTMHVYVDEDGKEIHVPLKKGQAAMHAGAPMHFPLVPMYSSLPASPAPAKGDVAHAAGAAFAVPASAAPATPPPAVVLSRYNIPPPPSSFSSSSPSPSPVVGNAGRVAVF